MESKEEFLKRIEEKVENERKNYGGPFCCLTMDTALKEPLEFSIFYDAPFREFSVNAKNAVFGMDFCPFCGKEFLKSLRDEWFDELSKILGFEVDISLDKRKIPTEFKSDEWWKIRGL